MSSPTPPAWLPPLLGKTGDWFGLLAAAYAVFETDFKSRTLRFRGRPVWYKDWVDRDLGQGMEEGFWHLITKDQWVFNPATRRREKQRLPELERPRYITWTRPTAENEGDPVTLVWDFEDETEKGPAIRTYLWMRDLAYVVVLERQTKSKGDIYMLVTGFNVDVPSKKEDLESRYERRIK